MAISYIKLVLYSFTFIYIQFIIHCSCFDNCLLVVKFKIFKKRNVENNELLDESVDSSSVLQEASATSNQVNYQFIFLVIESLSHTFPCISM